MRLCILISALFSFSALARPGVRYVDRDEFYHYQTYAENGVDFDEHQRRRRQGLLKERVKKLDKKFNAVSTYQVSRSHYNDAKTGAYGANMPLINMCFKEANLLGNNIEGLKEKRKCFLKVKTAHGIFLKSRLCGPKTIRVYCIKDGKDYPCKREMHKDFTRHCKDAAKGLSEARAFAAILKKKIQSK